MEKLRILLDNKRINLYVRLHDLPNYVELYLNI